MDVAAARPDPIPVFAEMSSTNPVFILPGALREKSDAIASGLHASVHHRCGPVLHQARDGIPPGGRE